MNLKLVREIFTPRSTIGRLFIDDDYECFTLEDFCREGAPGDWQAGLKIAGKTAIPYGKYEVVITFSERFKRPLPLLLKVPSFEGIRIHAGNTDANTDGCILLGKHKGVDSISESLIACSLVHIRIERAIQKEKVFISIEKGKIDG